MKQIIMSLEEYENEKKVIERHAFQEGCGAAYGVIARLIASDPNEIDVDAIMKQNVGAYRFSETFKLLLELMKK